METGPRRSQRITRLRREAGFLYDEDLERTEASDSPAVEVWQQRISNSSSLPGHLNLDDSSVCSEDSQLETNEGAVSSIPYPARSWSEIEIYSRSVNSVEISNTFLTSSQNFRQFRSRSYSQSSRRDTFSFVDSPTADFSRSADTVGEGLLGGPRRLSSTRGDFLDLTGNFLSVDSINLLAETPSIDSEMDQVANNGQSQGSSGPSEENVVLASVLEMMSKMSEISNKVTAMQNNVSSVQTKLGAYNDRIRNLEAANSVTSDSDLGGTRGDRRKGGGSRHQKEPKDRKSKKKGKKDFIDAEKERTYQLLKANLKQRQSGKGKSRQESEDETGDDESPSSSPSESSSLSSSSDSSSEVSLSRLASASQSASSSQSRRRSRRKKQVKSGSKIKHRPVLKTELWPHTVANENDGEEMTCDNIILSKFISCFTSIVANSKGVEAEGRNNLLHGIGLVLEDLLWVDAHNFHNLIMIKIEQRRLFWTSDFGALANKFIEKRLRKNARAKGASANFSSAYRPGTNYRNYGRGGYGNYASSSRNSADRSGTVHRVVCRQWNYGTCSYGANCKRWHCCWVCFESSKPGEKHRAADSHGSSSSTGGRQPEQQRF